jgi:hypothetical protein
MATKHPHSADHEKSEHINYNVVVLTSILCAYDLRFTTFFGPSMSNSSWTSHFNGLQALLASS